MFATTVGMTMSRLSRDAPTYVINDRRFTDCPTVPMASAISESRVGHVQPLDTSERDEE